MVLMLRLWLWILVFRRCRLISWFWRLIRGLTWLIPVMIFFMIAVTVNTMTNSVV